MRIAAALSLLACAVVGGLATLFACADAGRAAPPGDDATDGAGGAGGGRPPLRLARTAPLPGVRGRIDHLARDVKRGRLFVAALGNGSVEVVSLEKFERERSITGLQEPQGIAYIERYDLLAVACGGDGTVRFFDGEKLAPAATVKLGSDADNVRWNDTTKRLWVAFGQGGLASIDPASPGEPPVLVTVGSHPEGFAVDLTGEHAFANVPHPGEVAVCDLAARKVTARWKLGGASSNYPIALDAAAKRIYVGCRNPARLVVLSTADGKVLGSQDCSGDADDVFLDAARKSAYLVCGDGAVDVFNLEQDTPRRGWRVPTVKGARTGLFEGDLFWLAVPAQDGADAEIREYDLPRRREPEPR